MGFLLGILILSGMISALTAMLPGSIMLDLSRILGILGISAALGITVGLTAAIAALVSCILAVSVAAIAARVLTGSITVLASCVLGISITILAAVIPAVSIAALTSCILAVCVFAAEYVDDKYVRQESLPEKFSGQCLFTVKTSGLKREFYYNNKLLWTWDRVTSICSEGLVKGKRFTGAMYGVYVNGSNLLRWRQHGEI